jgi:putative ABC transport system permease protein
LRRDTPALALNVIRVAAANLLQHKTRLITAIAGIAVALFLLVLQFESLHAVRTRVSALYDFFTFDIALLPDTYQILISPGGIDRVRLSQAATLPEVQSSYGLSVGISAWAQPHQDNGNAVLVIGLDEAPRFIRDPEIRRGVAELTNGNSVLFDRLSQPDLKPFDIGHSGRLGSAEVEVKGLFNLGLFFYAAGAVIVPHDMVTRIVGRDPNLLTAGLLQLRPGADVAKVQKELRAILPDDVQVLTHDELIAQEQAYFIDTKPIGIMLAVGMLIACLVAVTIMIQVLATEIGNRLNEYAVLKAMGFGPVFIYAIGMTQSAILGIGGVLPALAISAIAFAIIEARTRLAAGLDLGLSALAFVVALGTALVAAVLVLWRIQRVDPAELY